MPQTDNNIVYTMPVGAFDWYQKLEENKSETPQYEVTWKPNKTEKKDSVLTEKDKAFSNAFTKKLIELQDKYGGLI